MNHRCSRLVLIPYKAAMFLEKDMQKNTLWFNGLSMDDVDKAIIEERVDEIINRVSLTSSVPFILATI